MMDPLSYADGFESDISKRHNLDPTSILRSKTFQTIPPINSNIVDGLIMIYPESKVINFVNGIYSTVTDLAKFLGWSTSVPRSTAT